MRLSRLQGFLAWNADHEGKNEDWIKFDGLSWNQIWLFHMLDAFLGLESFLLEQDHKCHVPALQRAARETSRKHSFRNQLSEESTDKDETQIARDMNKIVERLRVSLELA